MSHADALQKNHDVLQRCTTINFYVIDYLRAEDVLDEEQEHDLKTQSNPLRQRILLFQWLKKVSSDRYESFLQVMKDTEQEHVANLLKGSTKEDHLPLSDARYRRLVKIRHKMANVTRIDSEVIAELRGRQAISMTDAEEIRAEKVDSTKVSKFISVIMRRSNHSYNSFQEVLRKTLQTAAANFLSEGEMPAVHINNNRPDLDGPLSRAVNDLIRSGTTDDAEMRDLLEDLNGLGLNPVKAIPGQSIVIFIYCKAVDSAVNFTQLFNSGRLQYIIESILNRLLLTIEPHNTEDLDSRICLEDEEIATLEEFTGIEDWVREGQKRPRPSGEIYGCDATRQTDKVSFMKKITEDWNPSQKKTSTSKVALIGKQSSEIDLLKESINLESREKEIFRLEIEQLKTIVDSEKTINKTLQVDNDKLRQELETQRKAVQDLLKLKEQADEDWEKSTSDKLRRQYRLHATLVYSISIKAEEQKKSIQGLTILDNELFVLSEKSSEVEVYDSMTLSFRRQWNLKELIQPQDIASCSGNKCLYIFDYKGIWQNEILRVEPNGRLIRKWSTGSNFGYSLSVTDESNVILPVYNAKKLNEYSPDGKLIRELKIQSGPAFCELWHAVKLANGHFVVSLRSADSTATHLPFVHHVYGDSMHKVCIVNGDGKLEKSFNEKFNSSVVPFHVPFHLSVDRNGFVMVVDRDKRRVFLLDSNLGFQKEILSDEENQVLRYPTKFHLNRSNDRFFLAENEETQVGLLRHPTKIHLNKSNDRFFLADNDSNNQRVLIFDFK